MKKHWKKIAGLAAAGLLALPLVFPNAWAQFEQRVRNSDDIDFTGAISVRSDVFQIKDQDDGTKRIQFDLSGITAGATRTFVVPDSSGPLGTATSTSCTNTDDGTLCWDTDDNLLYIGDGASRKQMLDQASTQTGITGKQLLDTGITFANTSSTTKRFQFLASGITAGQTRIYTMPDYNATLASLAGSEALSNKSLASPVLTGTTTGTDITVTSTGDLNLTASGGTADVTISAGRGFAMDSASDFDITAVGASSDVTITSGRNIDILSSTAGYFNVAITDGDVSIATSGNGDDIVLGAATNGGDIYINGGLRLQRAATAVSASTSWHPIMGVSSTAAARTITLEADTNVDGHIVIVKDESCGASTNGFAITITPESGTIDGRASDTITTDCGSKAYYGNGTNWFQVWESPGVSKLMVTGYAKVGADAGWVVGAATNVGRLATIPAAQTGSDLVVPISGLKVGSTIMKFHTLGQIESAGNTTTYDISLRKLTAAAADLSDALVEAATQVSVTADTALTAANTSKTLTTPEVVDADESFYFLISSTTDAATDQDLMALVVSYIE